MEILLIWTVFSLIVASYASNRGRSGFLAFIMAVIISPLLAFILYLAIGESRKGRERRIMAEEKIRADVRRRLA